MESLCEKLTRITETFTKMKTLSLKDIAEDVRIAHGFSLLMPSSIGAGLKLLHKKFDTNGENSKKTLVSKLGTGLKFLDHNSASFVVASFFDGRVSQLEKLKEWVAPVSRLYLHNLKVLGKILYFICSKCLFIRNLICHRHARRSLRFTCSTCRIVLARFTLSILGVPRKTCNLIIRRSLVLT